MATTVNLNGLKISRVLFGAILAVALSWKSAWSETNFLCAIEEVGRPSFGRALIVPVQIATGQELRRLYQIQGLSDSECYAQLPSLRGGREIFRLRASPLFVTNEFTTQDFIRLFEVNGTIEVEGLSPGSQRWLVRARYPNLHSNSWVDPALNRKNF